MGLWSGREGEKDKAIRYVHLSSTEYFSGDSRHLWSIFALPSKPYAVPIRRLHLSYYIHDYDSATLCASEPSLGQYAPRSKYAGLLIPKLSGSVRTILSRPYYSLLSDYKSNSGLPTTDPGETDH